MSCCVPGCNKTQSEVLLHRLPHLLQDLYNAWLQRIGREDLVQEDSGIVYTKHRVCDLHFTEDCRLRSRNRQFIGLKSRSLPTLNLPGFTEKPTKENSFLKPAKENIFLNPSTLEITTPMNPRKIGILKKPYISQTQSFQIQSNSDDITITPVRDPLVLNDSDVINISDDFRESPAMQGQIYILKSSLTNPVSTKTVQGTNSPMIPALRRGPTTVKSSVQTNISSMPVLLKMPPATEATPQQIIQTSVGSPIATRTTTIDATPKPTFRISTPIKLGQKLANSMPTPALQSNIITAASVRTAPADTKSVTNIHSYTIPGPEAVPHMTVTENSIARITPPQSGPPANQNQAVESISTSENPTRRITLPPYDPNRRPTMMAKRRKLANNDRRIRTFNGEDVNVANAEMSILRRDYLKLKMICLRKQHLIDVARLEADMERSQRRFELEMERAKEAHELAIMHSNERHRLEIEQIKGNLKGIAKTA